MRKFREWAKAHGCWDQFKTNVHRHGKYKSLKELAEENQPDSYIENSFIWVVSPEGNKYWFELNREWLRYVSINYK